MRLGRLVRRLMLAGCLVAMIVSGTSMADAAQKRKLEWWMWTASEDVVSKFRQIEELFNSTHPDLELQLVIWPNNGYREKVVTAVAAGTPPAIAQADSSMHQYFAAQGAIMDISPLIREMNLNDIFLPVMNSAKVENRWYGITPFFHTFGMYLNMDAISDSGLPSPIDLAKNGNWTWDTYLEAAKKLTRRTDNTTTRYGIGMDGWVTPGPYIWSAGGEFTDETMTQFLLDSPEAIKGLDFYQSLRNQYGVAEIGAKFIEGKSAMWYNGTWNRLGLAKGVKFSWDVVEFPIHPTVRKPTVILDRAILTIPTGQKDINTSRTLLDFFLSPDVQKIYASTFDVIPIRRSVAQSNAFLKSGLPYGQDVNMMAFVSPIAGGRFHPYTPEWAQASSELQWDAIFRGEISPQAAIINAKNLFTALMNEKKQK